MCIKIIIKNIYIRMNTVEFVNIFSTINRISCMKTSGIHVKWNWNLRVFDLKLVVKNSHSSSPYFYFIRLVSRLLSLNNSIYSILSHRHPPEQFRANCDRVYLPLFHVCMGRKNTNEKRQYIKAIFCFQILFWDFLFFSFHVIIDSMRIHTPNIGALACS